MKKLPRCALLICLSFQFFGCSNSGQQLELEYSYLLGEYKSNYKKGEELLRLSADSTYVYEIDLLGDERYVYTGNWEYSDEDQIVTLHDWNDRVFSSMENENPKNVEQAMRFLIAVKGFKKVLVLRRDYDLLEEFDFVKQMK